MASTATTTSRSASSFRPASSSASRPGPHGEDCRGGGRAQFLHPAACVVAGLAVLAVALHVVSPSGEVAFDLSQNAGRLIYSVSLGRDAVVDASPVGIVIDGADLGDGVAIGRAEPYAVDDRYPWFGV